MKLKNRLTTRVEFMVYHPILGYLADAAGLKRNPVEVVWKEPRAAQGQRIIRHVKEKSIRAIMIQLRIFTRDAVTTACFIGGRTDMADPFSGDWTGSLAVAAGLFKKPDRS